MDGGVLYDGWVERLGPDGADEAEGSRVECREPVLWRETLTMEKQPTIAITRGANPVDRYRAALEAAGAEVREWQAGGPEAVAAIRDPALALREVDGILLPGGGDVDPHRYGEAPCPALGEVDPDRDALELTLAAFALTSGVPVLGVCRGIQVLAVAAGGRLWQDIPTQVPSAGEHRRDLPGGKSDRRALLHDVRMAPGSRLARLYNTPILAVNSVHHQAVRDSGSLSVSAEAPDGVVEGLEGRSDRFALGVQWHPEELWEQDSRYLAPFRMLVEWARVSARGR